MEVVLEQFLSVFYVIALLGSSVTPCAIFNIYTIAYTRKPNGENAKPQPQTETSRNGTSGGQRGHC